MEQHWSYKATSERWKGTDAVGLWIDRAENGRKQSRKQWFKVLLQRTFFRAVVGRASFSYTGKVRSWIWLPGAVRDRPAGKVLRGGADTSLHNRHNWHCPETEEQPLDLPSSVFTGLVWHTCSQKCPCLWTMRCSKGRKLLWSPPRHPDQGWWIPVSSAVVSVYSLGSKGSSTSFTPCLLLQLLTGLSWRSLFRHAVLLSHRNRVPQLTVQLKSEQLTKDF